MLAYPNNAIYGDLFLMNIDGTGVRQITTGLAMVLSSYAWSADSKRLVFLSTSETGKPFGFFIYDLQTASLRKITIIDP
jgi:Tol biopolymer transport system component